MKIVNRNLEDALNLYKKKNYFQAKSAFLKILKTQKVPPDIFFILYEISKNLNELDEAENYLIKYIEFDKNNHIAFNNLGNLYLKKNKYKEAEKYYLKAINLKKDYLPSILNLALYYEGLGNTELAKELYNKGLKISPKNIGIHFSLSKIDEKFISEKNFLGTAGSLSLVNKNEFKFPLILTNSDLISNINYKRLLNFHIKNKSDLTICVRNQIFEMPYGEIYLEGKKVLKIIEKPISNSIINAGVYVLSKKILKLTETNKHLMMNELINISIKNN